MERFGRGHLPQKGGREVRFTVFVCRAYNGFSGTEVLAPGRG